MKDTRIADAINRVSASRALDLWLELKQAERNRQNRLKSETPKPIGKA
jgi:hypothetical protein